MLSTCLLKKFVHGCGKGSLFPIEAFSFTIRWKADINVAHGRLHCTDACFPHIDKKTMKQQTVACLIHLILIDLLARNDVYIFAGE